MDERISPEELWRNGHKIEAIRLYREIHGCGLIEARKALDPVYKTISKLTIEFDTAVISRSQLKAILGTIKGVRL